MANQKVYRVLVDFKKADNSTTIQKFEEVVRNPLVKAQPEPVKAAPTIFVPGKNLVSQITPSVPVVTTTTQTTTPVSLTTSAPVEIKPTTLLTTEPPKETKPAK